MQDESEEIRSIHDLNQENINKTDNNIISSKNTYSSINTNNKEIQQAEQLEINEIWVQCDSCKKWRQIPSYFLVPEVFFCSLNPNTNENSCHIKENILARDTFDYSTLGISEFDVKQYDSYLQDNNWTRDETITLLDFINDNGVNFSFSTLANHSSEECQKRYDDIYRLVNQYISKTSLNSANESTNENITSRSGRQIRKPKPFSDIINEDEMELLDEDDIESENNYSNEDEEWNANKQRSSKKISKNLKISKPISKPVSSAQESSSSPSQKTEYKAENLYDADEKSLSIEDPQKNPLNHTAENVSDADEKSLNIEDPQKNPLNQSSPSHKLDTSPIKKSKIDPRRVGLRTSERLARSNRKNFSDFFEDFDSDDFLSSEESDSEKDNSPHPPPIEHLFRIDSILTYRQVLKKVWVLIQTPPPSPSMFEYGANLDLSCSSSSSESEDEDETPFTSPSFDIIKLHRLSDKNYSFVSYLDSSKTKNPQIKPPVIKIFLKRHPSCGYYILNCDGSSDTNIVVPSSSSNNIIDSYKETFSDVKNDTSGVHNINDSNQINPTNSFQPIEPEPEPEGYWEERLVNQYLIKLEGWSYLHLLWMTEDDMNEYFGLIATRMRISRFISKYEEEHKYENEDSVENQLRNGELFNLAYSRVDHIVTSENINVNGVNVEFFLVKWCELPYVNCTWETEEDLNDPKSIELFRSVNQFPDLTALLPATMAKLNHHYQTSPEFKNGNVLRDYQLHGLNWLITSYRLERNVILADEMGLGKTVQTIGLFYHLFFVCHQRAPFLVVAPLSTIQHWKREIEEWTDLNVVLYHDVFKGNQSRKLIREFLFFYPNQPRPYVKFQVLITTYETITSDYVEMATIPWGMVVVDEGHKLKNHSARIISALNYLNVKRKILLTGTPIQNNTGELFTLLHFLQPETFPNRNAFNERFGQLTEPSQVAELHELIQPFILRRLKETVEKSIPPREETIIDIELTTLQKQYYRAIYEKNLKFLRKGVSVSNMPRLTNIEMQLRKCCNHPWLIKGAEHRETNSINNNDFYFEHTIHASGKMVLISKLLPKLKSEGHKVLVFSGMVKMLDILSQYLDYIGYGYERLDGSCIGSVRQSSIDRFCKDPDSFIFLLSTRAGGLGLNLAVADTVILYDCDWNPQQDLQAQSRCHRIGQKNNVRVYRLVTKNTYETQMFERASKKLGLDQAVLCKIEQGDVNDNEDINRMLKLGAYGAIDDEDNSKRFCEEDIEQILKNRTRVMLIDNQKNNTGTFNFNKMSFASKFADSTISIDDPEFWDKLGLSTSNHIDSRFIKDRPIDDETRLNNLLKRLSDGSAVTSFQSRSSFFDDLETVVEHALDLKTGNYEIPYLDTLTSVLNHFSEMKWFAETARTEAERWLKILEGRTRFTAFKKQMKESNDNDEEENYILPARRSLRRRSRYSEDNIDRYRTFGGRVNINPHEDDFIDEEGENYSSEEYHIESDDEYKPKKRGRRAKIKLKIKEQIKAPRRYIPEGDLCNECECRGRLLYCDGPCDRSWHLECLEKVGIHPPFNEFKENENTSWTCYYCTTQQQICFICNKVGPIKEFLDGTQKNNDVVKCRMGPCRKYYHLQCVSDHPLTTILSKVGHFRCPLHFCSTCKKVGDMKNMAHCLHCPSIFHLRCLGDFFRLNKKTGYCEICLRDVRNTIKGNNALNSVYEDIQSSRVKPHFKITEFEDHSPKMKKKKKLKPTNNYNTIKIFSGGKLLCHFDNIPYSHSSSMVKNKKIKNKKLQNSKYGKHHIEKEHKHKKRRHRNAHNDHNHKIKKMKNPEELSAETLLELLNMRYDKYWCFYCGARISSGWNKGPWGENSLCTPHYIAWNKKKLDLSPYSDETIIQPINPSENSEVKYLSWMWNKQQQFIKDI